MNVASLCSRKVITVRESDELSAAARLMRDEHIGYLVVVTPDVRNAGAFKPVGVLTDRDVVISVVAKDTNPRSLRVGDVMTRDPVVVAESDSVEQAMQRMRTIGVRRLPVVGVYGQLVGVLSLDDIIQSLSTLVQDIEGSIRNERRIETALRP